MKPITTYYLAFDPSTTEYIVRCTVEGDDYVNDTVHSTYFKHDLAKRTCIELNEKEEMNNG